MSMNRIRRVVPTFVLAGALLAVVLSGAAGAASPPVGDWRMNEGSGTVLVDSSASGNNGTIFGNPTWVAGQHGQAIRFDGTGDYATVPDSASLDISSAITMAAWVKPEKTATQYLIKKATPPGRRPTATSCRWRRPGRCSCASTRRRAPTPTGSTRRPRIRSRHDLDARRRDLLTGRRSRLYVNGVQEGGEASPGRLDHDEQPGAGDRSAAGRCVVVAGRDGRRSPLQHGADRPPRSQRWRASRRRTRRRR